MARLIDAVTLKKRMIAFATACRSDWLTMEAIIDRIDTNDTVDAAPVVHGTWEEWYPPMHMIFTGEEKLYRCSACTAKYPDVEGFRYCPFCGAMMDGGTDCGKAD